MGKSASYGDTLKTPTYTSQNRWQAVPIFKPITYREKTGHSSYQAVTLPGRSLFAFCMYLSLASFLFYSHL